MLLYTDYGHAVVTKGKRKRYLEHADEGRFTWNRHVERAHLYDTFEEAEAIAEIATTKFNRPAYVVTLQIEIYQIYPSS